MLKNENPLYPAGRLWTQRDSLPSPSLFYGNLLRLESTCASLLVFSPEAREAELWHIHIPFAHRRFSLLKFKGVLTEKKGPREIGKSVVTNSFVKERYKIRHPFPQPPPPAVGVSTRDFKVLRSVSEPMDTGKKTQLGRGRGQENKKATLSRALRERVSLSHQPAPPLQRSGPTGVKMAIEAMSYVTEHEPWTPLPPRCRQELVNVMRVVVSLFFRSIALTFERWTLTV